LALYTVAVPVRSFLPYVASWFIGRAPGYGVAVGAGVAREVVTGIGVWIGVSGADCVGTFWELVHPALKITAMVMQRIPSMWRGFMVNRSVSVGKMIWIYCKIYEMKKF
jgi:hypothetical protein